MTATLDAPVNLDEVRDITDVVTPAPVRDERTKDQRMFDEAAAFVRRFWIPSSQAALDLLILWSAGTHATDADQRMVFETYPHLFFGSKGKASGKTTGLMMLSALSARAELITDPTVPAILALVDQDRASIVLDEVDTLAGKGGLPRPLRSFILDSYKRTGTVVRGNAGAPGGVKRICCFAPVALGGMWANWISNPQLDAARSRTIMVPCVPRRDGRSVESYRARLHGNSVRALNAGFAAWGRRNAELLADAWPTVPSDIQDRDAELVEPILAIGEAIGGQWVERARNAVRVLLRNEPEEGEEQEPTTPLEMLLRDLAVVFAESGAERMASRSIVAALQALPGSAWRRYPSPQAAGKEMAAILAPLGIAPKPVWLDGMTVRGYAWADLAPHCPDVTQDVADDEVDADELPW